MLRAGRTTLLPLDGAELAAIRSGDRSGRPWAPDYPTDGDMVIAGLFATADVPPLPWTHFQIRWGGLAVGGIGFLGAPSPDGSVELGYGLAPSARGRGSALQAVRLLLGWARDHGAHTVVAQKEPDNVASQAVLRRCGFVQEGARWVRALA